MMGLSNEVYLVTLSVALALPISSWAVPYSFTKIAESDGALTNFDFPSINNSGTVVFSANLNGSGSGIFTGNGSAVVPIAQSAGGEFVPQIPQINDSGTVVFQSSNGIFTSSGGAITPIANTSGLFSRVGSASISNAGTVAFRAELKAGGTAIVARNGALTTTIADTSGAFFDFAAQTSINGSGVVEFQAFFISGNRGATGIFTGNGGPTTTIAKCCDVLGGFSSSSINESGRVAFVADTIAGEWGAFTGNGGGPITTIADTTGPFSRILVSSASINNAGEVAFTALLDAAVGAGVFTGPNPLRDKIIGPGDSLFGSTVQGVATGHENLNDSGQVAFYYSLADGRIGIARADPVPEPGSFWLLGLGLVSLALVRGRARQIGDLAAQLKLRGRGTSTAPEQRTIAG